MAAAGAGVAGATARARAAGFGFTRARVRTRALLVVIPGFVALHSIAFAAGAADEMRRVSASGVHGRIHR